MPSPSLRARYALAFTVIAVALTVLAGSLPFFGGASADDTRELIRVTFRPDGARPLTGWRSDHGEPFDARRAYGWVRDNDSGEPTSMQSHAAVTSPLARRTETFITMQPPSRSWGRWVMDLETGTYRVRATVGDRTGARGTQNLRIEDTDVIRNFQPTVEVGFKTVTTDVEVSDGRLTLDPLYPTSASETKLISVVVSEVLGDDPPPPTEPTTTEPTTTEPPTTTPSSTAPSTTAPPTTAPPTTQPPTGLRSQIGFGTGGGYMAESDADIKREFDGMVAAGATWVRLPFLWSGIEQRPGVYWWSRQEAVLRLAQERGLRVVANVSYTPTWARPAGCDEMFCAPTNMDDYADFMHDLVAHFSPLGVKHYEVWNEPNQYFWWKPRPNPARYAEMARKAHTEAHKADPGVTVLAGVFAGARDSEDGLMVSPRTFLAGMYAAGISGHFDALAYHPYVYPNDPRVVADWNMISGVGPDLAAMMANHGDGGKKIWATEFAYATGTSAKAVSPSEQARLTLLAIDVWQRQDFAGPLIFFTYRNMGTNPSITSENFGMVHRDFTPKPVMYAMRDR